MRKLCFSDKSEGTGEKINVYQNPTIPDRVFQIHLVKKEQRQDILFQERNLSISDRIEVKKF